MFMDYLVGWVHAVSPMLMPWGGSLHMPCVPAIFLALVVRLTVTTVFAGLRVVMGLPVSFDWGGRGGAGGRLEPQ